MDFNSIFETVLNSRIFDGILIKKLIGIKIPRFITKKLRNKEILNFLQKIENLESFFGKKILTADWPDFEFILTTLKKQPKEVTLKSQPQET